MDLTAITWFHSRAVCRAEFASGVLPWRSFHRPPKLGAGPPIVGTEICHRSIVAFGQSRGLVLNWVVISFIFFMFTPIPGEMIQFDEHIFQRGWFNHQPVKVFHVFLVLG